MRFPTIFSKASGFALLGCLIIFSILLGCNKKKGNKKKFSPDSSIYSSQNFSGLTLDSEAVTSFVKENSITTNLSNEVVEFYTKRNNQLGWFNQSGMTCAAPNFYNQLQNYTRDFADNSLKNAYLDTLMREFNTDEKRFLTDIKKIQQLDLLLTATFFKYAQKVYGGTTKKASDLEWFIPRKKKNYQILIDSLVSSALCEKLQEPVNQYYIRLREQLKLYRIIQRKGGFPTIITAKKSLSVGNNDSCLLNAKKYLYLTNDLKINDNSIIYTDTLANAVINFQRRMGLSENGKLNKETLNEINKPIEFRIQQMMINMERLRWIPVEMEKDYLLINIPEYRLHVFENGKQLWTTNVVVGDEVKQTSIFKGDLSQIILNPYWGIPVSIVQNEILPHIKRNANYLANNDIEVFSGEKEINPSTVNWGSYEGNVPFNFRQKPGKNNALGKMKFMFPNNYHIYLHDTPSKRLFNETNRAFSHGCIRVENPKKLANYLLRNDPKWNPAKVDDVLLTDKQIGINIKPTIPVYITYFTAWVDVNGQLNFRNDLYDLDKKLSKEVFGD
ncbi:MAG: L,D-transpeptidase family protein [Arcicella sp.]|nr:L,D-transpeptidase family protein [Arcicella sp.]